MTLPNVGQTSTTKIVPYLSNDMFRQSRQGVDITGLAPRGSPADQEAALADQIREATAAIDAQLLGTLAATVDTEVGPITVRPDGMAVIVPRFRPVIALTAFSAGPSISQLSAYTQLSLASVEDKRILIPVGPFGLWMTSQGPLQFGPAAPIPGQLYARWTTCNGYPVTWLAASAAAGATTLDVADTTGIIAGQTQLTLYAGSYRPTFVPTAVSTADASGFGTGPGTLTLPTPLPLDVASDPLYPTYVSAMLPDQIRAARLMTRSFIKTVSGGNQTAATTSGGARNADPLDAGDDMAMAYALIDQYQMVQR